MLIYAMLISASIQCLPGKDDMSQALKESFQEAPQSTGVSEAGTGIEIFGSVKTGTWTVIAIYPSGMACIVEHGTDFKVIPQGDPA